MKYEIILTAILVALPCSMLGCFLILRKMVMIGDAISHAVLPGIVIAYLVFDSRDPWMMLWGAGCTGVLTTLCIEVLHKRFNVQEDAAIGVVFTFLFALGVLLISVFAHNIDLDQDCVLYGEIVYVPLHRMDIGVLSVPVALPPLILVNAIVFFILIVFYPYFKLSTFDSAFAAGVGMSVGLWNYVLMSLVSFTTVAAFESVGAILVIAFLVVPAASAYLWSKQLKTMCLLSLGFAIASVCIGYVIAQQWDVSISASIAMGSGILFGISFIIHTSGKVIVRNKQ